MDYGKLICDECVSELCSGGDEFCPMLKHLLAAFDALREEAYGQVPDLVGEITDLRARLDFLDMVVKQQAEDEGLWFIAQTCPEAYLQQELRKIHAAIER